MKVTNSDLALYIGPTARNMAAHEIRNGFPLAIPYWVDVDPDLISVLAPLTDTGGGRLARGAGKLSVMVRNEDSGEMEMALGMSSITEEQAHKQLLDAKDLKQNLEMNKLEEGLAKAQGLLVEELEQEQELKKLEESQERDEAKVDRDSIKKPAGSPWDGEKGSNALIDAHGAVLDNPKLIARFDALQDAINAEEELAKTGSFKEKLESVKAKRELESKLSEFGAANEALFRQWGRWRNTSDEKKEQVFMSLEVSEFYSVVQRANETGNVGTTEDSLKYDHSEVERFEDRSGDLCESSLLEDKRDHGFAGSMLHGNKSIQIQLHQAQGEGSTYEDLAKVHKRAKDANQAVYGWRK